MQDQQPSDSHRLGLSQKLKRFQDKSLKVDSRSPSIFLRKTSDKKSIDLTILENFSETKANLLKIIFNQKKSVCILKTSDSEEFLNQDGKLKKLYRTTNLLFEETGQKTLFVGFPFLEGHLIDGFSYIRAPLVLFPVSLSFEKTKKPPGWYLTIDSEREPIVNRALLSYLKRIGHADMPDEFQENILDVLDNMPEEKSDLQVTFFTELFKIFQSHNFVLADSADMEAESSLKPLRKDDIEKMEKTKVHLENYFVLGHFPQGNSAIYSDYGLLIEKALDGEVDQGIIDDLLEMPATENDWLNSDDEESNIDLDKIPDEEINVVLPSDSSQDSVLVASQQQDCTVVRGPPGTGKSQVIVNLISNALSKQQRVLLVCKKRAALDVVYQRLDSVGLGSYVVLVEDPEKDRSTTFKKFKRILESEQTSHPSLHSKNLHHYSQEIDELIQKQTKLVKALAKEYFGGISAHQLYVHSKPHYTPRLPLQDIATRLTVLELEKLVKLIPEIQQGAIKFEVPDYPLYNRGNLTNFTTLDQQKLEKTLDELIKKGELDQYDFDLSTLKQLQKSFEICKEKQGFFSSFNKEKKAAVEFIGDTMGIKISKSEDLDSYLEKITAGIDFRESLDAISQILDDSFFGSLKTNTKETITEYLQSLKKSIKDIPEIQSYEYKRSELNDIQKEIIEICLNEPSTFSESWDELIRDEIQAYWIDYIEKENPILQANPFGNYLGQKARLQELISKKRQIVTGKLIADIQDRITTIPKYKRKTPDEVRWSVFTSEVSKQRRQKPLRKLVDEYEDIVFSIAPCWLANPESVSQIFPLEKEMFDLIIYDEASQCSVEDALPSLYRGKRIVIAGDEKQLRPFDLWQIKEDGDEDDDITASESLFVLAKRIYGFTYLNWHYRSRYQDLIDFSNHAFYDGNLQVAPNVIRNLSHAPIRWIQCDGVWHNKVNLVESSRVVDEIFEIIRKSKDKEKLPSIGVITFNEPQQMAVLDEIEKRREDPEIEELYRLANESTVNLDDRLFVKNLENVQGDERDVIIFSVGYAKDPEGKFRHFFGSLSMEGGENRLNVAVTRARSEIVIISSINPEDIRPDERKNSGRQRLRDYLSYAKATSLQDGEKVQEILSNLNEGFTVSKQNNIPQIFESPFEEQVAKLLETKNYTVHTQVGYSDYRIDIGVVHPDNPSKYILGIECDGATFHSAKSTRERDVMRQEFLESRGWIIERIWSRNWWLNRHEEIKRITQKIEDLRLTDANTIQKH